MQLESEGFSASEARQRRFPSRHCRGQTYELTVPVSDGAIDEAMAAYLEEALGQEHERTYGHRAGPGELVELFSIQVVGAGLRRGGGVPQRVISSGPEPYALPPRRADLLQARGGPRIVEEYDSTCIVPPDTRAAVDAGGNIVIEM